MSHGSKIVDKVFNLIHIQRQDASQDFNFLSNRKKWRKQSHTYLSHSI